MLTLPHSELLNAAVTVMLGNQDVDISTNLASYSSSIIALSNTTRINNAMSSNNHAVRHNGFYSSDRFFGNRSSMVS